jgi:formate/nitrite transporter
MSAAPEPLGPTGVDAYRPAEIARRIEEAGVTKAGLSFTPLFTLSLMAGAFIAFGAAAFTAVINGAETVTGPLRFLGGVVFSMGLILVIVAGAELFTGNTMIVMAWADGRVKLKSLMRNWFVSFAGNALGACCIALLMAFTGLLAGTMGETAIKIASAKLALGPVEAFTRGILCNALVCLAVWLTFAARDVIGKIGAIILPIAAFVLLGYEHSIANLYFLPAGWAAGLPVDVMDFLGNIVPVTLGNIVGGGGGVALVYRLAYQPGRAR